MPLTDLFDIRPITRQELSAYKALRDAMLARHPEAFTSDAETEVTRSAESYASRMGGELDGGGLFTLGAWSRSGSSVLLGAVTCEREARMKTHHIAHLSAMMVADHTQGRGIGRALLHACIGRARSISGLEQLTLSVTSNNAAAVRLYESMGFVRYGRLVQAIKIGDRYHDKDHLVLTL